MLSDSIKNIDEFIERFALIGGYIADDWQRIKTALAELDTTTNRSNVPCGDCGKLLLSTLECDNPECVRVIMRGHGTR